MKDQVFHRYVWSSVHGGCIMHQRKSAGTGWKWCDWDSADEGQFPVNDAATKKIVKWYNLLLRINKEKDKLYHAEQEMLKHHKKIQSLKDQQLKLSTEVEALKRKVKP